MKRDRRSAARSMTRKRENDNNQKTYRKKKAKKRYLPLAAGPADGDGGDFGIFYC